MYSYAETMVVPLYSTAFMMRMEICGGGVEKGTLLSLFSIFPSYHDIQRL
ncbi:hypothetical protein VT99_11453, partial [Candidatus Electrothrix marina]